MPKSEAKATGVWKSFLLSFILPVIGGLIVYFRNKKRNQKLANICLTLSILHPTILSSFIRVTIESYSIPLVGLTVLFLTLLLMKVFQENQYRYFVPVWYFSLFGAIYSYYAYKKNKPLQHDVGWFFFGQLVIVITILIAILSYWISTYYLLVNQTV